MDIITVNAQEWKDLVLKIDRISAFVEQFMERLMIIAKM